MEQVPDVYEPVRRAFDDFANALLEQAVRHTDVWRRAFYQVPTERMRPVMEGLRHSAAAPLLIKPGEAIPYVPYPDEAPIIATELPETMTITVEGFDHRPHADWHETAVRLDMQYYERDAAGKPVDSARLSIGHVLGDTSLWRDVFMTRYAETGYEGHGFKQRGVSPAQLHKFLGLLSMNMGPHIPEQPFQDWYRQIIYTCAETGVEFRYDPKRDAHVSPEGVPMDKYEPPKLGDHTEEDAIPGLKVTAQFNIKLPSATEK